MAKKNNFVVVGGVKVNSKKTAKQIARQLQRIARATEYGSRGAHANRAKRVFDGVYDHTAVDSRGRGLLTTEKKLDVGATNRAFGTTWRNVRNRGNIRVHTGGSTNDVNRKGVDPLTFAQQGLGLSNG